ncbi:MAG: FAD-dependent monooxygenase [Deltaproteobacteria bacterium]|nr:FAD-dependent monooxygenase [Deltaproteobacteria bacterium]
MSTTTAAPQFDVIIVGAGVGGAACAVAFASAHPLRILLVERHAGPGNINRGDSLLPVVTARFSAWGILDQVHAAGARPLTCMQVFHHRAGLLLDAPLPTPGSHAPYLVLPHPDIERVLAEAARATGRVDIRYRAHVHRLVEHDGRVHGVILTDPAGDHTMTARLVIGADGSASALRAALGIPLARASYDHSYFGADLDRPADYADAMRIELHPAGGILVVPGRNHVAVAALIHREDEEKFRRLSFPERLSLIKGRSPLLTGCQAVSDSGHLYQLSRAHAQHYTAAGAVLIGDAIHLINPTAGQGMTMAIEDAAALARHLGPPLVTGAAGATLEPFLRAYEQERWPRNASQIRWSHWMSQFYAFGGSWGDLLRQWVFRFGASAMGRRVQQYLWTRMALGKAVH